MFLKVSEVASLLRVSKPTVRELCNTGILTSVKFSPHVVRITRESVDAYLRNASAGAVQLEPGNAGSR